MKEELKKIALELRAWAEKYDKDYVTVTYLYETLMANIDTTDVDYNKCNLFIMNDKDDEMKDER